MDSNANKPATGFITPANIFSMVQGLQKNSTNRSFQSNNPESKKAETYPSGDPDEFQKLLNTSRNPTSRFV